MSICVLGGDWRFPDEGPAEAKRGKQKVVDAEQEANKRREDVVSDPVKNVVRQCLQGEPDERPDIDQLIGLVEEVVAALPDEGDAALDMQ